MRYKHSNRGMLGDPIPISKFWPSVFGPSRPCRLGCVWWIGIQRTRNERRHFEKSVKTIKCLVCSNGSTVGYLKVKNGYIDFVLLVPPWKDKKPKTIFVFKLHIPSCNFNIEISKKKSESKKIHNPFRKSPFFSAKVQKYVQFWNS